MTEKPDLDLRLSENGSGPPRTYIENYDLTSEGRRIGNAAMTLDKGQKSAHIEWISIDEQESGKGFERLPADA